MIRKKKLLILIAMAAWLVVFAGAGIQAVYQHNIDWSVISGGGQQIESSNYTLNGTMGQSFVGPAQSDDHAVGSGYWYGLKSFVQTFESFIPFVVH